MTMQARPVRRAAASRVAALALAAVLAAPLLPAFAPPAEARSAPESFADLAATLLPGVVNIASSTNVQASNDRGNRGGPEIPTFPPGSPFEQFFKDFMDRNRRGGGSGHGTDQPQEPARRLQSLGSGFIIDPSGIVVTNNHVIDGADEITVTLQDNTKLKATLVGKDERADIAVLQGHVRQAAAVREVRRQRQVARRRLGAGDRQPVRPRRLGHRGHRLGARARHRPGPV